MKIKIKVSCYKDASDLCRILLDNNYKSVTIIPINNYPYGYEYEVLWDNTND